MAEKPSSKGQPRTSIPPRLPSAAAEERDRILALSQDLICIAGTDGFFKYVNPAWESLGYSFAELLSRPFLDFIHPDDHERNAAEVARLSEGLKTVDFENRYVCKDGSVRRISWRATPVSSEGLFYCIGRDITDQERLQDKLRNTLTLLESVYASLDEAVFVVDPGSRNIVSCNAAAEDIFGYREDELLGCSTEKIHVDKTACRKFGELLFPCLDARGIFRTEYTMRKKDGTVFPTGHTVKEIRDDAGRRVLVVSVVRDITESKNRIEALKEQEAALQRKARHLEEMNIAFKVLLEQRDREKNSLEANLSESVNGLIVPYLERLRKTDLTDLQAEQVAVLEANLREIVKPYIHRLSARLMHLTPMETRIAGCVRQGDRIKEIASKCGISPRTVEFHRDNIRKKLGIKGQPINLRTFLANIS